MNKDKKDYLGYLASFYWLPILIGILLLALGIHFYQESKRQEDIALYVSFYDCSSSLTEEELSWDFQDYLGSKENISFYTTGLLSDAPKGSYGMASLSRFYADAAAGQVDVVGLGEEEFSSFASTGCFLPLSSFLGEDWWIEHSQECFFQEGEAIGIYVTALPALARLGLYEEAPSSVIGLMKDSKRLPMAGAYLSYLAREK